MAEECPPVCGVMMYGIWLRAAAFIAMMGTAV
jgi:hypothetical protein